MPSRSIYVTLQIIIYISSIHSSLNYDVSVKEKWNTSKICPQIISSPPDKITRVSWNWGEVHPGRIVKAGNLTKPPRVEYLGRRKMMYTIYMFGLSDDNLTNKSQSENLSEWANWIIVNIPGANVPLGDVVQPYIPPTAASQPLVRNIYGILVLEQAKYIAPPTPNQMPSDPQRSIKFKEFSNLHKLSQPVYGNYFLVRAD